MIPGREEYTAAVGFAREPALDRRRRMRRVILALFLVGLGWLFWNRVVSPPDDGVDTPVEQSELPGPI